MSDDEENNSKEPEDFTVEELAQLNIDSAPFNRGFLWNLYKGNVGWRSS